MTGKIMLIALPALAVVATGAPAYAATGAPAYAASPPPPPAADLQMAYQRPEVAKDGSGVTWRWVLTNRGAGTAKTVVATHQVSHDQKIVGVSPPCAGQPGDVVCRFDTIKPGESRTGWIATAAPKAGGTLRVDARVTWHENPAVLPDLGGPSPVDASAPSGWESWGVSGTDAATRTPRSDAR